MNHPGISGYSRVVSNNKSFGVEVYQADRVATEKFIATLQKDAPKAAKTRGPIEVTVRQMLPTDVNYIIDSWAQSYRHSPDMLAVDDNLYKVEIRNRVYREIAANKVFIACDPQNEETIYGWICFAQPKSFGHLPVVSYVYVKRDHWLRGIGSSLVDLARSSGTDPEGPVWCYDWTLPMRKFADKVGMMRNPFLREAPQEVARAKA